MSGDDVATIPRNSSLPLDYTSRKHALDPEEAKCATDHTSETAEGSKSLFLLELPVAL